MLQCLTHRRRLCGPFETMRPMGIAGTGINHDLDSRAYGFPRRSYQQLIEAGIDSGEGFPPQLNGLEAALYRLL